jgi:hypothetical protein
MEPKIVSKGEKWLVFGFFGFIDALQFIFVETGVVGTIIDVGAGIIILVYGLFRKLWTTKKFLVMLATFIGEALPGINALPFWVLDVANLYSGTITKQKKEAMDQEKLVENSVNQPLNVDGSRAPMNPNNPKQIEGPRNRNGHRAPGGGLNPSANKPPMVDIHPPKIRSPKL